MIEVEDVANPFGVVFGCTISFSYGRYDSSLAGVVVDPAYKVIVIYFSPTRVKIAANSLHHLIAFANKMAGKTHTRSSKILCHARQLPGFCFGSQSVKADSQISRK